MAKLFCSIGFSLRNIGKAKSCGIANVGASFFLLKKFKFTDYDGVSKYFATLHSIEPDESVPIEANNYSLLVEGKSESRRTLVAKKLVQLFKIEYSQATYLVDSNTQLTKVGSANIAKSANAAESVGILKETILKYPWILSVPPGELKQAAKLLQVYCAPINETAPLLGIPVYQLALYYSYAKADHKIIPQKSRVIYFSEKLEYDVLTTCEALAKHHYLFMLPFERIHAIMTLLLDANILKMDIMNDLWIFRHCKKTIMERIKSTKEAGIERIKPWMLRCSDKTIAVTMNRNITNKILLGPHPSISSYLMARLECSENEVSYMFRRYPVLKNTNLPKLKAIIDYLYAEGYTPAHIVLTPRVLTHRFSTLKSRIEQLRTLGYTGKSLVKLCMPKRTYDEFIKKLSE